MVGQSKSVQWVKKTKIGKLYHKYLVNEYFSNVFGTAPGLVGGSIFGRLVGFIWEALDKTAARDGMVTSASSTFVPTETIDPSKAESLLSSRCFKRWRTTTSPLTTGTVDVLGNSESETEWDDRPLPTRKINHKKNVQQWFEVNCKRHRYKVKKHPSSSKKPDRRTKMI